jgi:hypothetical protein
VILVAQVCAVVRPLVDPVQPVLVALSTPLADELATQNRKSSRERK